MGLLRGAAPRSGPWHWRMCTPPHGRHAMRPTIHVDSGHLSIRGHQVLQAISWVPARRGVLTHLPWTLGKSIPGGQDSPEMPSSRVEGLERSTVSVADHGREVCLSVASEDRDAEAGVLPKASQQAPEPCPKDSLYPCTFSQVHPHYGNWEGCSRTADLTPDFCFTKTDDLISSNSILHGLGQN